MALMRDQSRAQLAFSIQGRKVEEFQVIRFSGTEGVSQLYRFEIELAATGSTVDFKDIVAKPAALSVLTPRGERYFHGIVSRFEMTGETVDINYFRVELVPTVWLLTHRYNSRIFQSKTVKEIITAVFTDAGIASDRFDLSGLTGTFEPHENCVQYRETDFNFVCRLMEEEGIYYFFEQTIDKHVMKLVSSKGAIKPIPDEPNLRYAPPTGLNVEDDHVYRFRMSQAVRPGAVVLTDYNFENPSLNLEAKADAGRDPSLTFSDFPGEYVEQGLGRTTAQMRAQEFEASRVVAYGQSNCRRLAAGFKFNLKEHPSSSFNRGYFLTSVTHQGKEAVIRTSAASADRGGVINVRVYQALIAARNHELPAVQSVAEALLQIAGRFNAGDPTANRGLTHWLFHGGQVQSDLAATAIVSGASPVEWLSLPNLISDVAKESVVDYDGPVYSCYFECIPDDVEYRPPRATPWPVMRGCQTARVVGPEGEEIQVDKFGRVRVQFHWDRQGAENGKPKLHGADSSCWIRVAQGWAGGQYGIMFIPRVGQEVVVDFIEGNPDDPIIIGRVFNNDHMPPYTLPDEKTKSTIKTRSTKGGGGDNEIRFEDKKDKEQLFIQAQRQMDLRVKASHMHTVGGSYHVHVGGEKDGNKHGDMLELVFKDKHVHIKEHLYTWVEQEEHRAIGGLQAVEIGGTRSWLMRKDAIDLFEANHQHEVTSTYYLKAGDVKIEASGSIELKGSGGSIIIGAGGIWITGTMVYINSGSGPPVPPTSVAGMCPGQAKDAGVADTNKPGKDTRYSGPGGTIPKLPPLPEEPGHKFPEETPPEQLTAKIEIELLDEADQPIAGEKWEIITPDGTIKRGVTDGNGRARVNNIKPGECKIRFLDLDSEAWIKHPTRPQDPIT